MALVCFVDRVKGLPVELAWAPDFPAMRPERDSGLCPRKLFIEIGGNDGTSIGHLFLRIVFEQVLLNRSKIVQASGDVPGQPRRSRGNCTTILSVLDLVPGNRLRLNILSLCFLPHVSFQAFLEQLGQDVLSNPQMASLDVAIDITFQPR